MPVTTAAIAEHAPAKLNLTLHVTGRRDDGYHLLDSLVVFPCIGDRLTATPASSLSLRIDGPFADGLDVRDNLVIRAAALLAVDGLGAALQLEKRLPIASGLGGGSSDAAAALRLLSRLWKVDLPAPDAVLKLGADVPVCLLRAAARMRGIGETLVRVGLPLFWVVLANPGCAVETAAVFARLDSRNNPPMPDLPVGLGGEDLFAFLAAQRNDLEAPAIAVEPRIAEVRAALAAQPGCRLSRMSGSGATCFGIFTAAAPAEAAAKALARLGWWTAAAVVN